MCVALELQSVAASAAGTSSGSIAGVPQRPPLACHSADSKYAFCDA
jgi:hypothetical protein